MYQNCESNQLKVKLNTFIVSIALNQAFLWKNQFLNQSWQQELQINPFISIVLITILAFIGEH